MKINIKKIIRGGIEMARTYNLSQGVEESFEFTITDPATNQELHYKMRYPSAADFEPSKVLDEEAEDIKTKMDLPETTETQKRQYRERLEGIEKEKVKVFCKVITPIGHDVDISDLLNRVSVVVARNFNNMINNELGRA